MITDGDLDPTPEMFQEMRRTIMSEVVRRRRKPRHLRAAVAGAIVLVAAGTTASVIATKPASIGEQNTFFSCYLEPKATDRAPLDVGRMDWEAYKRPNVLPAQERVSIALHLCSLRYADVGVVIPNPTACVLKDRRIGIFPNSKAENPVEFCKSLGLSTPK